MQLTAQSVMQKLEEAIVQLEADPAFKHAIISLYVVNSATGKTVFGRQEQTGLAPASTQKLFTSAAAYELLGQQFRFYTRIAYNQSSQQGVLNGDLFVVGSGDPTAGSWRWACYQRKSGDGAATEHPPQDIRSIPSKEISGSMIIPIRRTRCPVVGSGQTWAITTAQDAGGSTGTRTNTISHLLQEIAAVASLQ